jgi:hypothetical protein
MGKKDSGHKYYRRMVNHLFEETKDTVFFLPASKLQKPDKRTETALQECMKYEAEYRKEKLLSNKELCYD